MIKDFFTIATVVILTAALFLAVFSVLLGWVYRPTLDEYEWEEDTHRVKEGDSLWAISYEYCPENVDRREWVDEVQRLNNIDDGIIHPGQKLTVLVAKEG